MESTIRLAGDGLSSTPTGLLPILSAGGPLLEASLSAFVITRSPHSFLQPSPGGQFCITVEFELDSDYNAA